MICSNHCLSCLWLDGSSDSSSSEEEEKRTVGEGLGVMLQPSGLKKPRKRSSLAALVEGCYMPNDCMYSMWYL